MFISAEVTVTVHCPASVNVGAIFSVPTPFPLSVRVINPPTTFVDLPPPPVVATRPVVTTLVCALDRFATDRDAGWNPGATVQFAATDRASRLLPPISVDVTDVLKV